MILLVTALTKETYFRHLFTSLAWIPGAQPAPLVCQLAPPAHFTVQCQRCKQTASIPMTMFLIMTQLPGKRLVGLDIIIFGFFAQPNPGYFYKKRSQIAWKPLLFCRDFSVLEFKATNYTVLVFLVLATEFHVLFKGTAHRY